MKTKLIRYYLNGDDRIIGVNVSENQGPRDVLKLLMEHTNENIDIIFPDYKLRMGRAENSIFEVPLR